MKKILMFGVLFFVGVHCFAQELKTISVQRNGIYFSWEYGAWPNNEQWDSLFSKYKLEAIETDPFESNTFADSIAQLADKKITESFRTKGGYAYTVYLSMGARQFICFMAYDDSCHYWAYEVMGKK
jgi:hypothetical protein